MSEKTKTMENALPENMLKYYNYSEQMGRLKRALKAEFYLEALFIEYVVIEDRLKSILKIAGVFDEDKHFTLSAKIKSVMRLLKNSTHPICRYIKPEMKEKWYMWKEGRDILMHHMMKQDFSTDDLRTLAEQGYEIAKTLNSKVTSYRRYMEKKRDNI